MGADGEEGGDSEGLASERWPGGRLYTRDPEAQPNCVDHCRHHAELLACATDCALSCLPTAENARNTHCRGLCGVRRLAFRITASPSAWHSVRDAEPLHRKVAYHPRLTSRYGTQNPNVRSVPCGSRFARRKRGDPHFAHNSDLGNEPFFHFLQIPLDTTPQRVREPTHARAVMVIFHGRRGIAA